MSSNKDVNKKTKSSISNTRNGSVRRVEKEKTSDLRKIKKEDVTVSAKIVKQSSKSNLLKDTTDSKTDTKSVLKRTTSKTNPTMKTKSVDTPSKRIVKSQYFPSKNMYSNAVKLRTRDDSVEKKTIKETKVVKNKPVDSGDARKMKTKKELDSSSDQSMERPKTATLRKGSIVNANIVGPDAPPNSSKEETKYDYEDDFDSYESDFEEYKTSSSSSSSITDIASVESFSTTNSSDIDITPTQKTNLTDEERKLDSGNYELNSDSKHKQLLDNIKESVEKENAALSNLTSLSDEGFEDGKLNQAGSNNFINFLDAQKKCIRRKSLAEKKKRGEELFNMIKLDYQYFTLLGIPAITYDEYIYIYGNKSGHQASSQTGEDNVDDETQTEPQETLNKWTQLPIVISKTNEFNKDIYKMELNGVGHDAISSVKFQENYECNYVNLSRFLMSVEDVITNLIQQNANEKFQLEATKLPFSDGCIKIRYDTLEFLDNKEINYVTFSQTDETKFLTVHNSKKNNLEDRQCVICIWTTINPNKPEKLLLTYGTVTCCCFGLDNQRIVFGAFAEGTIAVWNLDECMDLKQVIHDCNLTKPNFITNVNYGHVAKIVAIQSLVDDGNEIFKNISFDLKPSSQICSLGEEGTLILWSVIVKINELLQTKHITLLQNSKIDLSVLHSNLKDMQCTDMIINLLDLNHLFISTNYGYILHYLTTGTKPMPKKYISNETCASNCLITCPFSPAYFLSGQENGKMILYSRSIEKQIKELSHIGNEARIEMLEWSYNKPFVFYCIDCKNNLHVWDLANSDIYPTHSVQFKDKVNFIRLSPSKHKENYSSNFMVIITDNCKIDLHVLNKEHSQQNLVSYQEDVRKFLNYVNRF